MSWLGKITILSTPSHLKKHSSTNFCTPKYKSECPKQYNIAIIETPIHIYQLLRSGRIWHKVIFKQSLIGLNSEFSFSLTSCLTKAEEPSLPYYLPIAGGRIIGFIPFPRVLVLCEMQSVSSRIWTRIAVSISYDDNNYTTGTS